MHRFPVVCGIDNSNVEDRENEAIGHDGERGRGGRTGKERERGGEKREREKKGRERGRGERERKKRQREEEER